MEDHFGTLCITGLIKNLHKACGNIWQKLSVTNGFDLVKIYSKKGWCAVTNFRTTLKYRENMVWTLSVIYPSSDVYQHNVMNRLNAWYTGFCCTVIDK